MINMLIFVSKVHSNGFRQTVCMYFYDFSNGLGKVSSAVWFGSVWPARSSWTM